MNIQSFVDGLSKIRLLFHYITGPKIYERKFQHMDGKKLEDYYTLLFPDAGSILLKNNYPSVFVRQIFHLFAEQRWGKGRG